MVEAARHEMDALILRKADAGVPISSRLVEGYPDEGVLREAKEWQADLIVIGSHGRRGLSHVLLGSVAEKVIRHASCPVLVVHPKAA
jgi:nucleotide-binding universal stress UspA family protein